MNRAEFVHGLRSNLEMSDADRRKIIRRSVKKFPWKFKCTVAMEEMAELQQQLSKKIRGYEDHTGLLEEMADVYICLSTLECICDISPEEMQQAIDVKLQRERERLKYFVVHTMNNLRLDCGKRGFRWRVSYISDKYIVIYDRDDLSILIIPINKVAYIELVEED